jgi:hypothetical protein
VQEGEYSENTMNSHMKMKNESCWNYSKDGGVTIKENDGGGEFSYDIL